MPSDSIKPAQKAKKDSADSRAKTKATPESKSARATTTKKKTKSNPVSKPESKLAQKAESKTSIASKQKAKSAKSKSTAQRTPQLATKPNSPRTTRRTKAQIDTIKSRFLEHYPHAKTELIYRNIYELLVCVMLSAQCTDKRVNIVTPALFARYPDIKSLANANLDDIKELIKSVSFFNNKARHLLTMAQQVLADFGGEVPTTQEALKSLAGVGQKTANVVLIEFFNANVMAVDTHVFRVSHRLGVSRAKSAIDTEADLTKAFKTQLFALHQAFVLFGRYVCKALRPECEQCFVQEFCTTRSNFKPA